MEDKPQQANFHEVGDKWETGGRQVEDKWETSLGRWETSGGQVADKWKTSGR